MGVLDGPHSPESAGVLVSRRDTIAGGPTLFSRRYLAQQTRLGAAADRSSGGIDGEDLGVVSCIDRHCPDVSGAASRLHTVEPPARPGIRLRDQYVDDLQPGTLAARVWRTPNRPVVAARPLSCLTLAHCAARRRVCFNGGESPAGRADCRCDRSLRYLELRPRRSLELRPRCCLEQRPQRCLEQRSRRCLEPKAQRPVAPCRRRYPLGGTPVLQPALYRPPCRRIRTGP